MEKHKTCYLCNTIEGLNKEGKCLKCSGEVKEVKPKCIIDSRKITPIKDIEEFVKISDEHFFEFEEYDTIVFGNNTISELIKMLKVAIDGDLDYRIFLALRMCGVEIWGSSEEKIKYKYRLPGENVFKKILVPTSNYSLKIQSSLNDIGNSFTLKINNFPSNINILNNEQYDNNSRFLDGIWIFILYEEQEGVDIKKIYEIIEITKEFPSFNFALKSFKNKEELKRFVTIDIDSTALPVILYRREFESYFLANGTKSKEELKGLLEKFI